MSATAAAIVLRNVSPLDASGLHPDLESRYPYGGAPLRVVEPFAHRIDARETRTGGLAPWQVKKVKQYIEARIAHGIPLDELAEQVRLSTSYFSTAFKSTFGISPHGYVVLCRVENAKLRMLSSNAPLCEIALDCGLADQSHLSRVFRRVTGTTPSAWRRERSRSKAGASLQ